VIIERQISRFSVGFTVKSPFGMNGLRIKGIRASGSDERQSGKEK
jgi:hypothetical protein